MTDAHVLEIQARFTGGATGLDTQRLCDVCAEVAQMSGAGIMMMSGDIQRGSLCTTNTVSALIEELQFSLSEGPCLDAFHEAQPILEPDLANPLEVRWMGFSGAAVEAGVRAIFGFPISVGSVKLGALNLYRDTPGGLTTEQHGDCPIGDHDADPCHPGPARPGVRSRVRFRTCHPSGVRDGRSAAGGWRRTGADSYAGARLRK